MQDRPNIKFISNFDRFKRSLYYSFIFYQGFEHLKSSKANYSQSQGPLSLEKLTVCQQFFCTKIAKV